MHISMKRLMQKIIPYLLLGIMSVISIQDVKSLELDLNISTETFKSYALLKDRNKIDKGELSFRLYLPQDYDVKREEGYPVLYLLHGSNGSMKDTEWDVFFPILDNLIKEEVIPEVIAVAPVAGNSYWVDSVKFGDYETAVNVDLIDYIDKHFNTMEGREGRILCGFSMGGYGALRYGLAYPDLYRAAILLSPFVQDKEPPTTSGAVTRGAFGEPFDQTIWDEKNYPNVLKEYVQQPNLVDFYIFATDDDWNHLSEKEDLSEDAYRYNMEEQAVRLYTTLRRKNIFNKEFDKWDDVPANPAQLRIINGGHDTRAWLIGFENGLKYVFRQEENNILDLK